MRVRGHPCGLGAVFTLIGAGIWLAGVLSDRQGKRLREQGQVVEATLQSVALNESISVNGRHAYVLHCQWLNLNLKRKSFTFFKAKAFGSTPAITSKVTR